MHPHRRKRLFNIILVLLFSTSGIGLILYSLNTNLDYFFTPTELKAINIPEDKRIKIGLFLVFYAYYLIGSGH